MHELHETLRDAEDALNKSLILKTSIADEELDEIKRVQAMTVAKATNKMEKVAAQNKYMDEVQDAAGIKAQSIEDERLQRIRVMQARVDAQYQ